jgi:hypothetical protein
VRRIALDREKLALAHSPVSAVNYNLCFTIHNVRYLFVDVLVLRQHAAWFHFEDGEAGGVKIECPYRDAVGGLLPLARLIAAEINKFSS